MQLTGVGWVPSDSVWTLVSTEAQGFRFQNGEPESCAESRVPRGQSIEQILGRNDDGEQPHDSSDDANRIVAEEIGHRGDEYEHQQREGHHHNGCHGDHVC